MLQINTLRAEVIRDLASHPEGSTTNDVGARIGADYRVVYSHMKALKTNGLVRIIEREDGRRHGPLYQLDVAALEGHFANALEYLRAK